MPKKIDSAKAAVQFCVDNGVTVKFQDDGSVKGSYYRPDGLGAVRAGQDNKMDFVEFVNALANQEKSQDDERIAAERLAEAEALFLERRAAEAAEAAEIAEVEAGQGISPDIQAAAETIFAEVIDAEDNGDGDTLED